MYQVLLPIDADRPSVLGQAVFVEALPAGDAVKVIVALVIDSVAVGKEPRERSASFHAVVDRLRDGGRPVDERRVANEPDAVILILADEVGANQTVMAGRKRSPPAKAVFRSTTQRVILNTDLPVTTVGGILGDAK